jgi:acyl-CoA reductase-like NAD-dependent aldehyde dehydrogenase
VKPHLRSHEDSPELATAMEVPGREYITSFDPATGFHIGPVIADNEVEIRNKIDQAGAAQRTWRKTSFTERRRVIRSLLKWLVDNKELCARVACRDTGKTSES